VLAKRSFYCICRQLEFRPHTPVLLEPGGDPQVSCQPILVGWCQSTCRYSRSYRSLDSGAVFCAHRPVAAGAARELMRAISAPKGLTTVGRSGSIGHPPRFPGARSWPKPSACVRGAGLEPCSRHRPCPPRACSWAVGRGGALGALVSPPPNPPGMAVRTLNKWSTISCAVGCGRRSLTGPGATRRLEPVVTVPDAGVPRSMAENLPQRPAPQVEHQPLLEGPHAAGLQVSSIDCMARCRRLAPPIARHGLGADWTLVGSSHYQW